MRANQIMTRNVVVIAADYSVYDAAEIMLNSNISAAPVVDADGKMIGIVSEADLMHRPELGTVPARSWLERLLADDTTGAKDFIRSHSHRVSDVMTKKVISAGEGTTVQELAALMQRHHVKRIPILREGKLVGIVSRANLLQGLLTREPESLHGKADDAALRTAVTATLAKRGWHRRRRAMSCARTASSISGVASTTTRSRRPMRWPRRTFTASGASRTT